MQIRYLSRKQSQRRLLISMTSTYPSSMMRIGQECGYPIGEAFKIQLTSYPFEQYHHYVVRINVTKINVYQQIPFVSFKVNGIVKRFNAGELQPKLWLRINQLWRIM